MATKADLHEIDPPAWRLRFSRLEQKIADVQIGLIKWFIRHADRTSRCDRGADQAPARTVLIFLLDAPCLP